MASERWCADSLSGDSYVTAGPWTGLAFCKLAADQAVLERSFVQLAAPEDTG